MFQVNPPLGRLRIHMKNQALFSSKDKSKKLKMSSAAIFVWHFNLTHCITSSGYF